VRNSGDRVEHLDFGPDCRDGLSISITDPRGDTRSVSWPTREGAYQDCPMDIRPWEEWRATVSLADVVRLSEVGVYRIRVRLKKGTHDALEHGDLTVSVGPEDTARLEAVCKQLADMIIRHLTYRDAFQAAISLGSVHHPIGLLYTKTVLDTTTVGDAAIFKGLRSYGSSDAIAILTKYSSDRTRYDRSR
jgi:hypothetical protein